MAPAGRLPWLILGVCALGRVWMVAAMPFTAAPVRHDDLLFVNQAAALVEGEWLGKYDELTLAKGPFYPLFVAASYAARLPLRLAQDLLYVAFCLVAVVALRPVRLRAGVPCAIGALLLFAPLSYSATVAGRVIREGIYPALGGLTIGLALGLYLRRAERRRILVVWAGALGIALAATWLTREEGVWIVLPVALMVGAAARGQRRRLRGVRRALTVTALPLLLAGALTGAVAATNAGRYGWFAVVELKTSDFRRAYGSLLRVGEAERRYVPVPIEVRRLLYEQSPRFAGLEPYLEGKPGRGYAATSCDALPETCGDVGGGWFIWLFREAAALDGHYASAEQARAFYARLAIEIDGICASGKVECGRHRAALSPPLHAAHLPQILPAMGRGLWSLARSEGFTVDPGSSTGRPWVRERFARMTRSAIAPTEVHPAASTREPLRSRLRATVAAGYRWLVPPLALAGALGAALGWRRALAGRGSDLSWVTASLAVAVLARLGLLAVIDVTSFHAMHPRLLSAAHPPFLWFSACGLFGLPRLGRWCRTGSAQDEAELASRACGATAGGCWSGTPRARRRS